jgi:hypothetical protein
MSAGSFDQIVKFLEATKNKPAAGDIAAGLECEFLLLFRWAFPPRNAGGANVWRIRSPHGLQKTSKLLLRQWCPRRNFDRSVAGTA